LQFLLLNLVIIADAACGHLLKFLVLLYRKSMLRSNMLSTRKQATL